MPLLTTLTTPFAGMSVESSFDVTFAFLTLDQAFQFVC